ncbi:MAG: redoxin domain-containing protein [Candidatus Rokubacteria bacterium]|nr:redoxin domain-containing protein [Candidatus Rokubacteria bacterium]
MTGKTPRAVLPAALASLILASAAGGLIALLTPLSSAAGPDFPAMKVQPYQPPKPAPAFALPDLHGKVVRLEDFRGKVVMLVFWTTW